MNARGKHSEQKPSGNRTGGDRQRGGARQKRGLTSARWRALPARRRSKASGSGVCELFFLCRHGGSKAITQRLERIAASSTARRRTHCSCASSPHAAPFETARRRAASITRTRFPQAGDGESESRAGLLPLSAGRESVFAGAATGGTKFFQLRRRIVQGGSLQ